MTDDKPFICVALVRRLIAAQFPEWAGLPIRPVDVDGWDNRTFRLGEHMSVRFPSAQGYTAQVAKEQRWLPRLASQLPLPIPVPLALGAPGEGYPYAWSVYRWLEGENSSVQRIADLSQFASTLGGFLTTLQRINSTGGPPPGLHSAFRGGPLRTHDAATRQALVDLHGKIDTAAAAEVWDAALAATWQGPPVWFHGDVAVGNLLIQDGRLSAVIDWGCAGVGDPSCDLAIAWTLFEGASRAAFRTALQLDEATWARGRGWTLWKALVTFSDRPHIKAREIDEVLADHRRADQHSRKH